MVAYKDGGPLGVLDELSSKVNRSEVALKLFLRSFADVRMGGGGPTGAGMSTFYADFDM
jgi:hypothetical protein